MKKLILTVAAVLAAGVFAMPAGFTDDWDAALKKAAAEKKTVLALFTGSDWCIWCQRLEGEVLSQKAFSDEVGKTFVPVFLDFPSDKSLVPEAKQKRNRELAEKYAVRGFPTVLLLDAQGKVLAQTGYQKGGPAPYVKYLMDVRRDGPNLRKRAEAEEAFFAPYGKRVEEMMKTVRKECDEAVKVPLAKARQTLDGIIRDLEAAQVSDDLTEKRDEFIEKLKGMKKMFKGED